MQPRYKKNISHFERRFTTPFGKVWEKLALVANPTANIQTLIAIPYNPYGPQPYNRWTMRGMLDLPNELKVADEFWDFLGGEGAYQDLLNCFERVGIELREEIDEYFSRFNRQ